MVTPQIKTFVLGEFQTNCFVVSPPGGSEAWIVDCGFDPEPMLAWVEQEGLRPSAILLTTPTPITSPVLIRRSAGWDPCRSTCTRRRPVSAATRC